MECLRIIKAKKLRGPARERTKTEGSRILRVHCALAVEVHDDSVQVNIDKDGKGYTRAFDPVIKTGEKG